MANWQPPNASQASPRFSTPGIFMNVELGVSFSNRDKPHTASVSYTNRRMRERLATQRREQDAMLLQERNHHRPFEEPRGNGPRPATLTPGTGVDNHRHHRQQQLQQQQLPVDIRMREHPERGNSAPPTFSERPQRPVNPVSCLGPIQHTSSMPLAAYERPLPPLPSQFRLGEDNLPWSIEPWYYPPSPEFAAPTVVGIERDDQRGEDPQRVRELEDLHHAMMTVDSLPHDGREEGTWDRVREVPRRLRSLGWAVRTDDLNAGNPRSPPPPYGVSQWAADAGWDVRPRSSG